MSSDGCRVVSEFHSKELENSEREQKARVDFTAHDCSVMNKFYLKYQTLSASPCHFTFLRG